MQQKQPPPQPKQQAGQHQPGQPGKPQPGKQGQPGTNPGRNEEFPGKAPDIYSDKNRDRSESPDAARKQGSHNEPSRRQ